MRFQRLLQGRATQCLRRPSQSDRCDGSGCNRFFLLGVKKGELAIVREKLYVVPINKLPRVFVGCFIVWAPVL